jgi:acyl-[acyl carrier protein]--UDP-N-acetylglucosamine O-acyltransferase
MAIWENYFMLKVIITMDVCIKSPMAGAVIQPGTYIGENSIVNTSVSVDHDCIIGQHVHIAPGSTVCGGVRIEDNVYIGSGAVIVQGVRIAPYIFIKAGTIVTRDVLNREAAEKEQQG